MIKNKYWRYWCRSLGEKVGESDNEADKVALIRTIIALVNLTTCLFIIANIVYHW